MKNALTKLANDYRLSDATLFVGLGLSIVGNILVFTGVYYTALHRGVQLRDAYYEETR